MKKIISTSNAPAAIGPYSQAVEAGGYLFVSGQLPLDPDTMKITGQTIEQQSTQVFSNIGAILKEAGFDFSDLVKVTVLLNDINDFKAFNQVYAKYFECDFPARAAYQVAALPLGALVEIECIAYRA